MKEIAKYVLTSIALRLPWGARQAIYEALQKKTGQEESELNRLARSIGITAFMAEGESGLIEGDSCDQVILPTYARSKTWAAGTNRLFVDFFKERSGTYIDVGANIGLTTIPVASNPNVRCHAFEPDPVLFFHLSENIRRNCEHSNVMVHQTALGEIRGKVKFAANLIGNRGDNRVVVTGNEDPAWRVIQVPIERLDNLVADVDLPLGVKIDTQGYEPFVVAGGSSTLSKAALIVMEFSPLMMSRVGGSYMKLIELISGFKLAAIKPAESESEPNFEEAGAVCEKLERFAKKAQSESDYVDVVISSGSSDNGRSKKVAAEASGINWLPPGLLPP